MPVDRVCEFYEVVEKKYQGKPIDRSSGEKFFQTFFTGKCSHDKCKVQTVSCYGMIELCQITDVCGKD